tara:strand:+ start:279 stop:641 length:363 start_codon:yes stop_codon:yes gene_type:complete
MRLTKDGTDIANKTITDAVPTYNTIWLEASKEWFNDQKLRDDIKAELKKENKNFNPLDNVKVLPNDPAKPVVKKTTPAKAADDKSKPDAKSKTDPTASSKSNKDKKAASDKTADNNDKKS